MWRISEKIDYQPIHDSIVICKKLFLCSRKYRTVYGSLWEFSIESLIVVITSFCIDIHLGIWSKLQQ